MASNTHSDLEVVAPSANDTNKYPYYSPEPIPAYPNTASDTNKIAYESATYERPAPARICGLRNRTFWIVVIAAIIVVAGAVGGGVGGALASRSSSNSSAQSSSTTQTPTSSTPTSSTEIISTSTIVGPTNSPEPTLLRDCPSSNNSIYSVTYGSTSYQFRKLCNNAYLNVNGVSAQVQGVVKSLDDCIDRCAIYNRNNATEIQAGRDPICNAVCWRNTFDKANDWEGGHCFGYTTQNTTVNGQTSFRITNTADICDSAALINQDF